MRAVCCARRYGDDTTTVGCLRPRSPNQRPSADAWSRPRFDNGTSMSRSAMSIIGSPADSAESRATLPQLSPWRTSCNDCGHRSPSRTTRDEYPTPSRSMPRPRRVHDGNRVPATTRVRDWSVWRVGRVVPATLVGFACALFAFFGVGQSAGRAGVIRLCVAIATSAVAAWGLLLAHRGSPFGLRRALAGGLGGAGRLAKTLCLVGRSEGLGFGVERVGLGVEHLQALLLGLRLGGCNLALLRLLDGSLLLSRGLLGALLALRLLAIRLPFALLRLSLRFGSLLFDALLTLRQPGVRLTLL